MKRRLHFNYNSVSAAHKVTQCRGIYPKSSSPSPTFDNRELNTPPPSQLVFRSIPFLPLFVINSSVTPSSSSNEHAYATFPAAALECVQLLVHMYSAKSISSFWPTSQVWRSALQGHGIFHPEQRRRQKQPLHFSRTFTCYVSLRGPILPQTSKLKSMSQSQLDKLFCVHI